MVGFIAIIVMVYLVFNTAYAAKYSQKFCEDPDYTCYIVKKNDSWQKLFPDEAERNTVMKINRMNTRLQSGTKIAIPNTIKDYMDYAPLPAEIDPPGQKLIMVSFEHLAFGAYNKQGKLEYWGPISGGKGYCSDTRSRCNTPRGQYTVGAKGGSGCVSTKFPVGRGGAPMPYCMFFHRGFALHGSYKVPGYNDSHGCVRLFVNDAQWLNQEFTPGERTRVLIK